MVRGMRRLLRITTAALLLAAGGCSSTDSSPPAAPAPSPTAGVSQEQARSILAGLTSPQGGTFTGGTFEVSHPIPGPDAIVDGRLASMSWDFYYLLDSGERGSWGTAVKIFGTPDQATEAADAFAVFWACDGPRTVIGDIDPAAYDDLQATYCHRAGGTDYLATVSAAKGRVTASMTVAAPTSGLAVAEIEEAWRSLAKTARQAADEVG